LGAGDSADRLQVAGDQFFASARLGPSCANTEVYVETGLISSPTSTLRLVEKPTPKPARRPLLWIGTATTLFWSDGSAVFSRAVSGK
ncbi:MAG TPA: hypothetical protein VGL19_24875, partial [Polyangiaceae bacterium]